MSDLTSLLVALAGGEHRPDQVITVELIAAAREHGVAKLLYDLQRAEGGPDLSEATATVLLDIARQETAVELARMLGTKLVLDCLASAGVPVLLLKGSALAYWLYDNPAQRSRCDLDILVADKASATRAITALEENGYQLSIEAADRSAEFEVALERRLPGGMLHRVDLHWRVLNHARLAEGLTFADLDAGAIDIPALASGARGLGPVHALLHALLHRITNMPSGQHDRLIWLYDIHLLALRCTDEDWAGFVAQCARLRCATPSLEGLRATRAVFATPRLEAIEGALEQQARDEAWPLGAALDQGTMDRAHLAALSWPQKVGWLRRKLFPSRQFMRYRYGAVGNLDLVNAYLGRWWVGLRSAVGRWR